MAVSTSSERQRAYQYQRVSDQARFMMRLQFTPLTITGSLEAISLPSGQILGVIIDNPSGAWLRLFPTYDFIPPYTLGWSRTLPGASANITLQYAPTGPANQISTSGGALWSIWLDSDAVNNSVGISSGAPFIEGFTPILTAQNSTFDIGLTTVTENIAAAISGQRFRIWTISAQKSLNKNSGYNGLSPVRFTIGSPFDFVNLTGGAMHLNSLGAEQQATSVAFSEGLDIPVSQPMVADMTSDWANNRLFLRVTYSVI